MENHLSIQRLGGRDRRLQTLEYVLETEGYTVTFEYVNPAPIFSGLAAGDYDFNLDVWKPVTHGAYIEEFEGSMAEYE